MTVFCCRECSHLAIKSARHHDRNFVIQRQQLFQYARLPLHAGECRIKLRRVTDSRLALAVVTEAAHFENSREQLWMRLWQYFSGILDHSKRCDRKTVGHQKLFLQNAILGDGHAASRGTDDAMFSQDSK